MSRRRRVLAGGAAVLLVTGLAFVWATWPPPLRRAYDRVRLGMSVAEVDAVLPPGEARVPLISGQPGITLFLWESRTPDGVRSVRGLGKNALLADPRARQSRLLRGPADADHRVVGGVLEFRDRATGELLAKHAGDTDGNWLGVAFEAGVVVEKGFSQIGSRSSWLQSVLDRLPF